RLGKDAVGHDQAVHFVLGGLAAILIAYRQAPALLALGLGRQHLGIQAYRTVEVETVGVVLQVLLHLRAGWPLRVGRGHRKVRKAIRALVVLGAQTRIPARRAPYAAHVRRL